MATVAKMSAHTRGTHLATDNIVTFGIIMEAVISRSRQVVRSNMSMQKPLNANIKPIVTGKNACLHIQIRTEIFRPEQSPISTPTPTVWILANVDGNVESILLPRAKRGKPVNQKRTRRGGKKHKSKFIGKFSILGNNCAGLKAKKDSLESIIKLMKTPSCITLQETKLAKNANFWLENYQVFL